MGELLTQPREEILPEEKVESQEELSSMQQVKINRLQDEILHLYEVLKDGGYVSDELNQHIKNITGFKTDIIDALKETAGLDPKKDTLKINSLKMYIAKKEEKIREEEGKLPSEFSKL